MDWHAIIHGVSDLAFVLAVVVFWRSSRGLQRAMRALGKPEPFVRPSPEERRRPNRVTVLSEAEELRRERLGMEWPGRAEDG